MPESTINLLPEQEQRQVQINPYVSWFFKTGVYFLLATYVLVLAVLVFRWYRETQLVELNRSIQSRVENLQQNPDLVDQYQDLQRKYALVDQVVAATQDHLGYMELVETTIPAPVSLDKLQLTYPNLILEGQSTDYFAINEWKNALSQSPLARQVTVKNVDRSRISAQSRPDEEATENIQFVIEMELQ